MSPQAGHPGELLLQVERISRQAGRAILEIYQRGFEVTHKADASPLTQADLASHREIVEALQHNTPELPLLSEESAQVDFATRSSWREYWLIDPLDGTKEFIKRNGEFTVNIALIREHRPALGVVHVPVSGISYLGGPGIGAWRMSASGELQDIHVQVPAASPLRVVGSRSHANPQLQGFLERLGEHQLVSMGSSLKFCLLAEGEADFYPRLGPTSEWDTAAAHAVVLGAGGAVMRLDGSELQYNRKESMLNPEFFVLADTDQDYLAAFQRYTPAPDR